MTTRTTDLAGAARAMDELVRRLADADEIRDAVGESTTDEIGNRGARTSSPRQAHLVAGAFGYRDGTIRLDSSRQAGHGTAGELVWGAEFGSSVFPQFGPRHSSGTWIFPTLRSLPADVISDGERAIDDLIGDAI